MKVEGELYVKIGKLKAPTGYYTNDWDDLVSFVKDGVSYAERHLLSDADFDLGEQERSDIYHFVNNGKLLLERLKENV